MIYLHKSVFQSHGYLSSANCHLDSRWVLKISGFALHAFRNKDCREQASRLCFFGTFAAAVFSHLYLQSPLFIQILYQKYFTLVYYQHCFGYFIICCSRRTFRTTLSRSCCLHYRCFDNCRKKSPSF